MNVGIPILAARVVNRGRHTQIAHCITESVPVVNKANNRRVINRVTGFRAAGRVGVNRGNVDRSRGLDALPIIDCLVRREPHHICVIQIRQDHAVDIFHERPVNRDAQIICVGMPENSFAGNIGLEFV